MMNWTVCSSSRCIHLLQTRQPFAVLDVSEAALAIGGDAWSALLKLGRVPTLVSLN